MKKTIITLTIVSIAALASAEPNQKQINVFNQMDADKDGFVTYAEYMTVTAEWDKKVGKERKHMHNGKFKRWDVNKDGKLTLDEMWKD